MLEAVDQFIACHGGGAKFSDDNRAAVIGDFGGGLAREFC